MPAWKLDIDALVDDMHRDREGVFWIVDEDMIFLEQVRTGTHTLTVPKFLAIAEKMGKDPSDYIVEVE